MFKSFDIVEGKNIFSNTTQTGSHTKIILKHINPWIKYNSFRNRKLSASFLRSIIQYIQCIQQSIRDCLYTVV